MSHSSKLEMSLLRRSLELRRGGVPHDGIEVLERVFERRLSCGQAAGSLGISRREPFGV